MRARWSSSAGERWESPPGQGRASNVDVCIECPVMFGIRAVT